VTFGTRLFKKETPSTARAFHFLFFLEFVHVLLTACLVIVPTLDRTVLGVLLAVVGAVRLIGLVWVFRRYLDAHREYHDIDALDWLTAIVAPALCYLLIGATGAGFVLGVAASLTTLAIVNLVLLSLGIYGAWSLVVWMALAVNERSRGPSGDA
jgi:hypothetical protein